MDNFAKAIDKWHKKKYNIGNGKKNNRIAYYRMYNINVTEKDKIKPASSSVKKVSYKLGNVKLQNGSTTSSSEKSGNVNLTQTGIYKESNFVNVTSLCEGDIKLMSSDDLSQDQLKGVSDWKNNIDYENDDGLLKFIRVIVMFMISNITVVLSSVISDSSPPITPAMPVALV